jgi:hypothetical protein
MERPDNERDLACSFDGNPAFFECIDRGEDESVCRMQRVPCICRCAPAD